MTIYNFTEITIRDHLKSIIEREQYKWIKIVDYNKRSGIQVIFKSDKDEFIYVSPLSLDVHQLAEIVDSLNAIYNSTNLKVFMDK